MTYSLIGRDIHQLVKIKSNEDWTSYAWRIHERDNLYWVPMPNTRAKGIKYLDRSNINKRIRSFQNDQLQPDAFPP